MSLRSDPSPWLPRVGRERLESLLGAGFFVALLLSLPVAPVVVSAHTDLSLLPAIRAVIPAIAVGYVLGLWLLLR